MIRYLKNFKWPQNPEILLMLILGILLQMIDGSPFSMNDRWRLVWDIELPSQYFSNIAQKIIKTIITMIIIVRCSTTYAYVISAMLVIFCLLKRSTPKLMLLWLLVAGVKSICTTFVEALAGVYICSAFGKIRKACIEFFISKALEIIFAAYLWGNVLSIYQEMETNEKEANLLSKDLLYSSFTRQRARSLIDESTLYKTACLNNFEFRDVPQIILQMLRTDEEMSQDSLIGPGMMLASVSNLGSFDDLKTSQSLGELGFMDLRTTQVVGLEEDENLPRLDKVLKFLKLTRSDVAIIKLNKATIENDIYTVDDEIWAKVIASGTHINKPKQARTEVFIREIPPPEEIAKNINERKKNFKLKITFSNLFIEKPEEFPEDQEDEDSLILGQDEEEGNEDEICRLFMSNIKEGCFINHKKYELRVIKGNQYENLYKQEFMSTIGPEVFERATNLPKVTSFIKTVRNSVSLPEMKELLQTRRKSNCQEYPSGKIESISSSELKELEEFKRQTSPTKSFIGEIEKTSTEGEMESNDECQTKFKSLEIQCKEQLEDEELILKLYQNSSTCQEVPKTLDKISQPIVKTDIKNCNEEKMRPCFRKRRILIKRIGNRKTELKKQSFDDSSSSRNSSSGSSSKAQLNKKNRENLQESSTFSSQINDFRNSFGEIEKKTILKSRMYFVTEILNDSQWKLSFKSENLTKKSSSEEKQELWLPQSKILYMNSRLNNVESENEDSISFKEEKTWKSNVLKTVEACFLQKYYQTIEQSSNNKAVLEKILKTKYSHLSNKSFSEKEDKIPSDSNFLTPSVRSMCFEEDINSKTTNQTTQCSKLGEEVLNATTTNEPNEKISVPVSENPSKTSNADFVSPKSSNLFIIPQPSKQEINKTNADDGTKIIMESRKKVSSITNSTVLSKESSIDSEESEESVSLYYSKAADLASPLLDMKRFIYPDHIHYSYKHVNKKGFDVDMNGGLPLLVGENVTVTSRLNTVNESTPKNPELEIKRRPMDLSFATSNAFADWQSGYSNDVETKQNQSSDNTLEMKKALESIDDITDEKLKQKAKKMKIIKKINERNESRISNGIPKTKSKPKSHGNDLKYIYSAKDYILIEKLLRMHVQFNKNEYSDFEKGKNDRGPIQISSTQLHSNKGRQNSIKNPAIFLQKNKTTRNEKKKFETQEERTKDMFTRLAREAFLQNSDTYTSSGSKKN